MKEPVRENTEIFIGLEVNSEKTKYMIISCQQNIVIENSSFEKVEKFKYLGVRVTIRTTSAKELKAE